MDVIWYQKVTLFKIIMAVILGNPYQNFSGISVNVHPTDETKDFGLINVIMLAIKNCFIMFHLSCDWP